MGFVHLRYFAKLGRNWNIMAAPADNWGIAQPGLSRQIHDLETELARRNFRASAARSKNFPRRLSFIRGMP